MDVETMQELLGIASSEGNDEVKRGRQPKPKVEQDGDVVVLDEKRSSASVSRSRSPEKKAKKVKEEASVEARSAPNQGDGTNWSFVYDTDRGAEGQTTRA
jgi:hypothetical protein